MGTIDLHDKCHSLRFVVLLFVCLFKGRTLNRQNGPIKEVLREIEEREKKEKKKRKERKEEKKKK